MNTWARSWHDWNHYSFARGETQENWAPRREKAKHKQTKTNQKTQRVKGRKKNNRPKRYPIKIPKGLEIWTLMNRNMYVEPLFIIIDPSSGSTPNLPPLDPKRACQWQLPRQKVSHDGAGEGRGRNMHAQHVKRTHQVNQRNRDGHLNSFLLGQCLELGSTGDCAFTRKLGILKQRRFGVRFAIFSRRFRWLSFCWKINCISLALNNDIFRMTHHIGRTSCFRKMVSVDARMWTPSGKNRFFFSKSGGYLA